MKSFCVVHFLKSNQVDFVPSKWINENQDKCRYPKATHPDFETLKLDANSNPPTGWAKYKIRIVGQSDAVTEAERIVSKYLETSDIELSEVESHQRAVPSTRHDTTPVSELTQGQQEPTGALHLITQSFGQSAEPVFQLVNSTSSTPTATTSSGNTVIIEPSTSFFGPQIATIDYGSDPTVAIQQKNSELLQKILENQAVQEQQIKDIKALLLRTINEKQNDESGSRGLAIPFIPLSTSEELEHLENWLKSPENFKLLVTGLAKVGGHQVSLNTYAILNYAFTHPFALQVRLTERSGKVAIGTKKIVEAVRDAVRTSFPSATNSLIDQHIGSWFRTSIDRKGGRKRKNGNSKKNNQTTSPAISGDNASRLQDSENAVSSN